MAQQSLDEAFLAPPAQSPADEPTRKHKRSKRRKAAETEGDLTSSRSMIRVCSGPFEAPFYLPDYAKPNIHWWLQHAADDHRQVVIPNVMVTLTTDASCQGSGAFTKTCKTGERWTTEEATRHINVLELLAVLLGLQALCQSVYNTHIHIKSDNTTTVAFIENMGGCHSLLCNTVST